MKCHKCGSDLDTGFNCTKCDYKHNQKQLTAAEKLLWIVENNRYVIITPSYISLYVEKASDIEFDIDGDREKAINAAYKWVKEQENAKNSGKPKKRDWSKVKRICKMCGNKENQGEMFRFGVGWICDDCFRKETILDEIEEW